MAWRRSPIRRLAFPGCIPTLFPDLLLAARLLGRALFNHGLRRCEPRDWNPERRRADVIHLHFVTELYAGRISAVLAADSNFQFRTNRSPPLNPPADQHS